MSLLKKSYLLFNNPLIGLLLQYGEYRTHIIADPPVGGQVQADLR